MRSVAYLASLVLCDLVVCVLLAVLALAVGAACLGNVDLITILRQHSPACHLMFPAARRSFQYVQALRRDAVADAPITITSSLLFIQPIMKKHQ